MKAIFFDFDGTLTYKGPNIWQSIWLALGFNLGEGSEHQTQLDEFLSGKISYQEWCNKTLECYKQKDMNIKILQEITSKIKLLNGATETFKSLKDKGYELHIISGNIVDVIENVLGENVKYFSSINANDFIFDEKGKLDFILGTEYDCEGKAKFINEYITKTNSNPKDLYFVGNGFNDEWAHLSCCNTICINPDETEHTNKTKWHTVIEKLTDLQQILPFIK